MLTSRATNPNLRHTTAASRAARGCGGRSLPVRLAAGW